ncbi:MAG: hypothetical protein RL172_2804, partial [Bacteroidota bacterium]
SNKQCQYFFYVYKGKRSNSRLPAEAVVLLQGIAAGK